MIKYTTYYILCTYYMNTEYGDDYHIYYYDLLCMILEACCDLRGYRECVANDVEISANICRLVLNEVFAEVMQVVHKSWMQMNQGGKLSLMDFPKALRPSPPALLEIRKGFDGRLEVEASKSTPASGRGTIDFKGS